MTLPITPRPAVLLALLAALAGCATGPATPSSAPSTAATRAAAAADAARQAETQRQVDAQRQADFNRSLDRWHGASVTELVAKLGKPNSMAREPDGTRVYIYSKSTPVGAANGAAPFTCVVRYRVDEKVGKIVGHRIEGC